MRDNLGRSDSSSAALLPTFMTELQEGLRTHVTRLATGRRPVPVSGRWRVFVTRKRGVPTQVLAQDIFLCDTVLFQDFAVKRYGVEFKNQGHDVLEFIIANPESAAG